MASNARTLDFQLWFETSILSRDQFVSVGYHCLYICVWYNMKVCCSNSERRHLREDMKYDAHAFMQLQGEVTRHSTRVLQRPKFLGISLSHFLCIVWAKWKSFIVATKPLVGGGGWLRVHIQRLGMTSKWPKCHCLCMVKLCAKKCGSEIPKILGRSIIHVLLNIAT